MKSPVADRLRRRLTLRTRFFCGIERIPGAEGVLARERRTCATLSCQRSVLLWTKSKRVNKKRHFHTTFTFKRMFVPSTEFLKILIFSLFLTNLLKSLIFTFKFLRFKRSVGKNAVCYFKSKPFLLCDH